MKLMKNLARSLTLTVALGLSATAFNAGAALPVGAKAPAFELQGALAGKPIAFSLQQALQKGPVVLYFFPAAFTAGCTIEAHAFAEATDEFNKMGATVIGVTAGNTDQVSDFSKLECRDKFAVAAAISSGRSPKRRCRNRQRQQIRKSGIVGRSWRAICASSPPANEPLWSMSICAK